MINGDANPQAFYAPQPPGYWLGGCQCEQFRWGDWRAGQVSTKRRAHCILIQTKKAETEI